MTDHATAETTDDDPAHAVWQEYPVSLFGDGMRVITVRLGGRAQFAPSTIQVLPRARSQVVAARAAM